MYVLNKQPNEHYDSLLNDQFFDVDQYKETPLAEFIGIMAENFTHYQKFVDQRYQIVPTQNKNYSYNVS